MRQRVHALNHTAAFVWQRCDGRTAPADIAAALSAEVSLDDADAVVRLTLQELADAHLLTGPLDEVARVSRRDHVVVFVVRAFRQEGKPRHPAEIVDYGFFARDALPPDTTRGTRARLAELFDGAALSPRW